MLDQKKLSFIAGECVHPRCVFIQGATMNKTPQKTYHLYHHQPYPLAANEVHEQAWLVNNGINYSVVATIAARTPEEAYQAVREKMAGHGKLSRFVTLQIGNLLRETQPGDVLVGKQAAWMIVSETQIRAISYEEHEPWKSYARDETVWGVRWSPNGRYVAAISDVVSIHSPYKENERYSTTSYHHSGSYTGHAVEWSPDRRRIASGGYSGEVHVWKPEPDGGYSRAARGSIVICRTEEEDSRHTRVTAIAWTPDSKSLLAGKTDGDIVHWDAVTGDSLHVFNWHQDDVNALVYSPDGTHIASASDDGTVCIWRPLDSPSLDVVCHHAGAVSSVAWSPDGTLLVSACTKDDQSLHFWDPTSGEPSERIPLSISFTTLLTIVSVAWSPDGRYIAAGCDDGTVQVVDVGRRRHMTTFRSDTGYQIKSVAWSPDGTCIAAGGSTHWGNSGRVKIWQVEPVPAPLSVDGPVPTEGAPV
jgi:WD40 repeat protein